MSVPFIYRSKTFKPSKEIKPFFVYIFYLFFLSLSSTVEVDLQ